MDVVTFKHVVSYPKEQFAASMFPENPVKLNVMEIVENVQMMMGLVVSLYMTAWLWNPQQHRPNKAMQYIYLHLYSLQALLVYFYIFCSMMIWCGLRFGNRRR